MDSNQRTMRMFLVSAADLYINFHLKRAGHSKQFEDGYSALMNFLDSYAFERAGPTRVYKSIGIDAVQDKVPPEFDRIRGDWAQEVWDKCKEIQKKKGIRSLNPNSFPLCVTGSDSMKTSVLSLMAQDVRMGSNTNKAGVDLRMSAIV